MGPLSGCKVIEVTADRGMFAGKLLRDMGAEVVRIEPPGSDRTGADFLYCNAGKRRVTLDLTITEGRELFRKLASEADILLEDGSPGKMAGLDLAFEDLKAVNSRIIYASITDFGQTGPQKDARCTEAELQALAGWLSVTGELDRPMALPGKLTWKVAGLFAVNGILLALYRRHESGTGQFIDISIQECAAAVLDHVLVRQACTGETAVRQGSLHWNNAFRVFPCRDGHILLSVHRQWETLVEWMASEGMASDLAEKKYRDESYRNGKIGYIISVLEQWTMSHTVAELEETGQLMRFPWSKVRTLQELLQDEHLNQRGAFSNIEHKAGISAVPGVPVRMQGSHWQSGSWLAEPESDNPEWSRD